jgi:uncharacterized RDD family membrane protein YckC
MNLASRGKRLGAALIDALLFAVPLAIVSEFEDSIPLSIRFVFVAAAFALMIAQLWLVASRGQTFGKIWLGIRIVRRDTGENGGFVTNVLLRGLLNGVLGLIPLYFFVDSLLIFRDDRRCLHDMMAGTVVVDAEPAAAPPAAA